MDLEPINENNLEKKDSLAEYLEVKIIEMKDLPVKKLINTNEIASILLEKLNIDIDS